MLSTCSAHASCWFSLTSMMVMPVPQRVSLPWRQSWSSMTYSEATIIPSMTFQMGSSRPIPRQSPPPPPFRRSTITIQLIWVETVRVPRLLVSPVWKSTTEAIMELNDWQSSYHNLLHDLPHVVEQANTTAVPPPLGGPAQKMIFFKWSQNHFWVF